MKGGYSIVRSYARSLFFSAFAALALSAAAYAGLSVSDFLAIDRFQYYLGEWSAHMRAIGRDDVAQAVAEWTPEYLAENAVGEDKLSDAYKYDELILELLAKNRKTAELALQKPNDLRWSTNFLKTKLNEAYSIDETKQKLTLVSEQEEELPKEPAGKKHAIVKGKKAGLTFDSDAYISSRTTRAVFWDATANDRTVEFHVGSARDFLERMNERQMKILGEVTTLSRNYNKIYLIQSPSQRGPNDYSYAITGISGGDRLEHLVQQLSLASWTRGGGRAEVFGSVDEKIEADTERLRGQMRALPRADRIVIGQKGAIGRSFDTAAKAEAIIRLFEEHAVAVSSQIDERQQKLIDEIKARKGEGEGVFSAFSKAPEWDALYEKLEPLFGQLDVEPMSESKVFTIDNGSHEFSDFLFTDRRGVTKRWRVFSNVWGDEIIPIARALKDSGYNKVSYLGIAGAFPGKGLEVGDLVAASQIVDAEGIRHSASLPDELPVKAKLGVSVAHVGSPFDETDGWAAKVAETNQVVEIESGYLAKIFNGMNDELQVLLMISDVIGVPAQGLDDVSSSKRKRALRDALSFFLAEDGALLPATQGDAIPGVKDPVFRYLIARKILRQKISDKAEVAKLIENEAQFSTAFLEKRLRTIGGSLSSLLSAAEEAGIAPRLAVSTNFLEGSWNPKSDQLVILLRVSSAEAELALNKVVEEFFRGQKGRKQFFDVKIIRGPPSHEWRMLSSGFGSSAFDLIQLYAQAALANEGLIVSETRSGALKFVETRKPGDRAENGADRLSFFGPDEDTQKWMQALLGGKENPEAVLSREIERINKRFKGKFNFFVDYQVSRESLAGNALAGIVPVIGKDGALGIRLQISAKGLENPAVVLEEIVHLYQITNAPAAWADGEAPLKSFIGPLHWLEVTWNAAQGSRRAQMLLARHELETVSVARDAAEYYSAMFSTPALGSTLKQYFDARTSHAEEILADATKVAKSEQTTRTHTYETTKAVMDGLERQKDKLDDLVARNDRAGVRKLVEKYVPWALLEPSEAQAWKKWLDAMERPNLKNRKLVFRGMYDDRIMTGENGAQFLFSTILSRNQGNYTRRLRSLSTMRERFGQEPIEVYYVRDKSPHAFSIEGQGMPEVSMMMYNHSIKAQGSPFLSVSNFDVARDFGARKIGAFLIDEARLMPNALAYPKYAYQQEWLVPLIIFPDEVVYIHDYDNDPKGTIPMDPELRKKDYLGRVAKALGRKVTKEESDGLPETKDFLREGLRRLVDLWPQTQANSAARARISQCERPLLRD